MPSLQAISFQEFLKMNDAETARWQVWFERQPAEILEVPVTIANAGNVRGFLLHIFAVELRHTERITDSPNITPYESLPTDSISALFGIGVTARKRLGEYPSQVSDQELSRTIEIQTRSAGVLHAPKRRLAAHIFVHSIRHWAQMATLLREHGYKTDWSHDLLFMQEL